MKKLGLLLVVCLLLGALSAKPAAAQDPEYGYISLLPGDADPTLPRNVIARATYDQLLPRLMEARAEGLLADFEPDFYGGYVRLVQPSIQPGSFDRFFQVFPSREKALDKKVVFKPIPGTQSVVSKFRFYLYSSSFDFYTGIPDAHVKGTLKTPAGEVLGVINTYADSSGDIWDWWDGYSARNVPGYKINLKVYNSSEVLVGTYSVTIPRIVYGSIDKPTGKITGTGPAGKPYHAHLFHPNLNAAGDYYYEDIDGTISGAGNWSADFSIAFRGGDSFSLEVDQNSNFTFVRDMTAPRVGCRLQSNYCWLQYLPNKTAELKVIHGGTTYTFSGKTDYWGELEGELLNSNGDPVLIVAGDKISGTNAVTEVFPKLTLSVNRAADTVSGIAPANKWVTVDIYDWTTWANDDAWVKSNSTGNFTATFSIDIPGTGTIESDIWYINPSTGNYWYYYKMIP